MTTLKVRRHRAVTLPPDLAAALRVEDGGYVTAEFVGGGVLLKPLSTEDRRRAALEDIRHAQAGVRSSPEMAALTPEEQEDAIAAMLGADDDDARA